MKWDDWRPKYLDIVQRLDIDSSADRKATELLTSLLRTVEPQPLLKRLSDSIFGRHVIVCGAGPSLKQHMNSLMKTEDLSKAAIVVADGAVSVMLELGLHSDVLVTDLDGNIEHLREMKSKGSLLIVHAHGDNIERVRVIVPLLGDVLGSTQVEPTDRAFLWGGFTDGDRACHIVCEHSPQKVTLAGMDFGTTVGRWSKPGHEHHYPADERKRIKLKLAEELIADLLKRTGVDHSYLL